MPAEDHNIDPSFDISQDLDSLYSEEPNVDEAQLESQTDQEGETEEDNHLEEPTVETEEEETVAETDENGEEAEEEDPEVLEAIRKMEEAGKGDESEEDESFTDVDPDSLSEENRKVYEGMRDAYQTKTRELAETYRVIDEHAETLGSIFNTEDRSEIVKNSVEVMSRLGSDDDYRVQFVLQQLQSFKDEGRDMSALSQFTGQSSPEAQDVEGDDGSSDPRLTRLEAELRQTQQLLQERTEQENQSKQAQEEEEGYNAWVHQFESNLSTLQKSKRFSELNDQAWEGVKALALTPDYSGDVIKAADYFKGILQGERKQYLQKKTQQPNVTKAGGSANTVSSSKEKAPASLDEAFDLTNKELGIA
jgi:hypothetical protein